MPGVETPTSGGEGVDGSEGEQGPPPPAPGEPTGAEFRVEARGAEPVDQGFVPQLLLARNGEEGARAALRSPISGPDALLQGWDNYADRSLVVVLGGSQPDSSYRVALKATAFIRNGTTLLASGQIDRKGEAASSAPSLPWVIVSVDAAAADVVSKCLLALEAQEPRATKCP